MHSAFLIQKELMPRRVLAASLIASRQASSKLVGDCAITSILRTIDMWTLLPEEKRLPTCTAVVRQLSRCAVMAPRSSQRQRPDLVAALIPRSTRHADLGPKPLRPWGRREWS